MKTAVAGKLSWFGTLFVAGLIAYLLYLENTWLQVTRYQVVCPGLPQDFQGFRIALISDLHGNSFGDGQSLLASAIRKFEPDMIAIAGDLLDEREFTLAPAFSLIQAIKDLAPVYYVCGNHEVATRRLDMIQAQLEDSGVHVLRNQAVSIEKGESSITIAGLDDPLALDAPPGLRRAKLQEVISKITAGDPDAFTILLSHRPELVDVYAAGNVDLVLSGHAHGGLIRIPGIGGLVAPGQGLLPRYTAGVYRVNHTCMVVGRGLGNSRRFQLRVFNRPELVLITLTNSELQRP